LDKDKDSKDHTVYSNRPEEEFKHNYDSEPKKKLSKELSKSTPEEVKSVKDGNDIDPTGDTEYEPNSKDKDNIIEIPSTEDDPAKTSPNTQTANDKINEILDIKQVNVQEKES